MEFIGTFAMKIAIEYGQTALERKVLPVKMTPWGVSNSFTGVYCISQQPSPFLKLSHLLHTKPFRKIINLSLLPPHLSINNHQGELQSRLYLRPWLAASLEEGNKYG